MQQLRLIWLIVFAAILILSCSQDSNTLESEGKIKLDELNLSHSEKGWELYSWPVKNSWKYSLMVGTNRLKNYNEVTGHELVVTGQDSIKLVLEKLPRGETIMWPGKEWLQRTWGHSYEDLQLPPDAIIEEIRRCCDRNALVLFVASVSDPS